MRWKSHSAGTARLSGPILAVIAATIAASPAIADDENSAHQVAAKVDGIISAELAKSKTPLSKSATDEDFLRRVCLDLTGKSPTVKDITLFGINPDSSKRAKVIDRLLDSDDYARTWARYWRDVVMMRATDQKARLAQRTFEEWLVKQFRENRKWSEVITDLITATGDVRENGEAALIFAHNADAKEIAAETSRIFMGIQIQCANCHNHPTDKWKREQFHQLAAYFPRMRVSPIRDPERNRIRSWEVVSAEFGRRGGFMVNPDSMLRQYDKNKDGKITAEEVKGSRLERGFRFMLRSSDRNRDRAISKSELEQIRQSSMRRLRRGGGTEYYMPNLENPSSRGTKMDPVFFVGTQSSKRGLNDLDRRKELAKLITSPDNKWFARAFVNRIWAELLGEGFYMPVDDMGPQRNARFPKALDALANGFVKSGYDVKWLYRTIANTQAYQRQIKARSASDVSPPFASAAPTRLRSDQIYDTLTQVLGVNSLSGGNRFGRRGFGGGYRGLGGDRQQFTQLFGFDPSTPQEDITGTVPQALYLMNSPSINNLIKASGQTRLAQILREFRSDDDALGELYLLVLSREPSKKELKICKDFIAKTKGRSEAFEDIMWSLLNSSEFLSKR